MPCDKYIAKLFLRGDSVMLVVKNPVENQQG